ncbi:MAG: tetratricopeptide repeat protein [Marinilabiliales bacterium]|nr:MAG: tetratricopeptide repeat protein [Marinilabiliales bacterium]
MLAAVSAFSCVSVSKIEIQVLEPASDPLPPEINRVLLLNRTIADTVLPPLQTVRPEPVISDQFLSDLLNQTTTELIFALADILNESPGTEYMDSTMILETGMSERYQIPLPLDPLFVSELCGPLAADALISLEYLRVVYSDSISEERWNSMGGWNRYYWALIDVDITAGWRIYEGGGGGVIDEYVFTDTLVLDFTDWDINEVLYKMPDIAEVFMETAYLTALDFARRISPHWMTGDRMVYFRGNRNMRKAYRHFISNELEIAEAIYLEQLDRMNRNLVAAAMHNLALVNEMRGDSRQALVWARRSYQVARKQLTAEYVVILEERAEIAEQLDRQLGVE